MLKKKKPGSVLPTVSRCYPGNGSSKKNNLSKIAKTGGRQQAFGLLALAPCFFNFWKIVFFGTPIGTKPPGWFFFNTLYKHSWAKQNHLPLKFNNESKHDVMYLSRNGIIHMYYCLFAQIIWCPPGSKRQRTPFPAMRITAQNSCDHIIYLPVIH